MATPTTSSILTLSLFILHHSNSLEFRVRVVSKSSPILKLDFSAVPDCIPVMHTTSSDPNMLKSGAITVYRPVLKSNKDFGYVISPFKVTTRCNRNFLGSDWKQVLEDKMIKISDTPRVLIDRTIKEAQSLISNRYSDLDSLFSVVDDLTNPDIFYCSWLSTTEKTTIVMRGKRVPLAWNLRGELLQPVYIKECLSSSIMGNCILSDSDMVIYIPQNSKESCELIQTTSMEGAFKLNHNKNLITFDSFSSSFEASFPLSYEGIPELLCQTHSGTWIIASEEGHLVSSSSEQGIPTIFQLIAQNNIKTLPLSEWGAHHNLSSKRTKRKTRRAAIATIFIPPNINTDLSKPTTSHSPSNSANRKKRHTIFEFPEFQRLQILEEHMAWGFSEISSYSNRIGREFALFQLELEYQDCLQNIKTLKISRALSNPYVYSSFKLNSNAFIIKDFNSQFIRLIQGTPAVMVTLNDTSELEWCNGMVLIISRLPDTSIDVPCWLMNEIGICLEKSLITSCSDVALVDPFFIPTYSSGSYDLRKKSVKGTQLRNYTEFNFHFLKSDISNDSISLEEIRHSMGSYMPYQSPESVVGAVLPSPEGIWGFSTFLTRLEEIAFWGITMYLAFLTIPIFIRCCFLSVPATSTGLTARLIR